QMHRTVDLKLDAASARGSGRLRGTRVPQNAARRSLTAAAAHSGLAASPRRAIRLTMASTMNQ
ncbi:hypothetical protein, partial [Paraburkholderia sp.]|uniref:hypothetical protein n=1 Tax=Paraburkholderia sp. TaxID=1926495 RepID=UPI00286F019C